MADGAATASAPAPEGKQQHVRPEKPDEEKYKEELAKAEKAHAAAQEKFVSIHEKLLFLLFLDEVC
jgi:hypothetical protein